MPITLTESSELFQDALTGESRNAADGDNPEMIYTRARFSNGYECFIKTAWGTEAVAAEIQNIITNFDSDVPPLNWQAYNGFGG